MKKKILFGLTMLIASSVSLFAQAGYVYEFRYLNNLKEQTFNQHFSKPENQPPASMFQVSKLPNPVIQAINNNLRDYSFIIGDVFVSWVNYQGKYYAVFLRITDVRDYRWQFFAWRQY